MAVDMFIKIDGIKGEAQGKGHTDEVDVLAWSWGMSQSATFHQGSGGGSGKSSVQDISLTKYVDSASHALQLACLNGKHIPKCTLTVQKAGENPVAYIVVNFENCIVSSISTGGSGGEDRLTENVTLNFAKVHFAYTPQKKEGGGGGKQEYKWSIPENATY
jgi:type VI secretion system secreted protein Hcp